MSRRFGVLMIAFLFPATPAWAHKLDGECQVLPGRMVRVKSWFQGGDPPKSCGATRF